jgi:predicted metal-dependent hydrolase
MLPINEIVEQPAPKEYVSGEKFAYWSKHYKLKVTKDNAVKNLTISLYWGLFIASVPKNLLVKEPRDKLYIAFKQWYISHGQAKVQELLDVYPPTMDLSASKVSLKE